MIRRLRSALAPTLAVLLAGGLTAMAGGPTVAVLAVAAFAAAVSAAAFPARDTPPATAPTSLGGPGGKSEALLEALPIGVVLIAVDGTIRFANGSAAGMFGLPGDKPGRLPRTRLPAATLRAPRLLGAIDAARLKGRSETVDLALPGRGDLRLRAHVRPAGDAGIVVAVEDRTEALRAQVLHRDFVANASHELKTPLAALSATIETLLGHARDDPAATERFLGLMAGQVRRMTRLVEDLLSLNRVEQNERVPPREPQNLATIVAEAVEVLRPAAAEAGARLIHEAPGQAPAVPGDRNELGQVARNLIENAIRYGGAGVEVRVGLTAPSADRPGMVGIAVSDTGPGIAREHLPRLTERFYRVSDMLSREAGGTGLGLAIVKHVVARHRGRLEIDSTPGEGSRFTVWLPLAEPDTRNGSATER